MADAVLAARHTLTLVTKNHPELDGAAKQCDEGIALEHGLWMLTEIIKRNENDDKAHRWLGYAQAMLISYARMDLTQAKTCVVLS